MSSEHQNSKNAFSERIEELSPRAQEIYGKLVRIGQPKTDREILQLCFPGREDMNLVRPRLTELKHEHWVEESGDVKDAMPHVEVRKIRALSAEERQRRLARVLRSAEQPELIS